MQPSSTGPFSLGDYVTWWSSFKTKHGRIVGIAPAGSWVSGRILSAMRHATSQINGGSRDHESYIVEVDNGPTRKPTLYWPRVSALKKEQGNVAD